MPGLCLTRSLSGREKRLVRVEPLFLPFAVKVDPVIEALARELCREAAWGHEDQLCMRSQPSRIETPLGVVFDAPPGGFALWRCWAPLAKEILEDPRARAAFVRRFNRHGQLDQTVRNKQKILINWAREDRNLKARERRAGKKADAS